MKAPRRGRLERSGGGDALKVSKDLATRGADAVDGLRNSVTTWFNFYNGYDPAVHVVDGHAVQAGRRRAAGLRGVPARQGRASRRHRGAGAAAAGARFRRRRRPKFNEVPDLQEIIALPQDEMRDVVAALRRARAAAVAAAARRAAPAADARGSTTTTGSTALKTLDFDAPQPQRAGRLPLHQEDVRAPDRAASTSCREANPPRKTDNTGIPGAARGRDGLIFDLADEMIPYTPEQLIALANKEFAWHEEEMKKASRQMGFGDDWKTAVEKVKGMHVPARRPAGGRSATCCSRRSTTCARKDLDHRAAGRQRIAAHVDDVARSAAVGAVLPRRLADHRVVSDQHDGVRRAAAEHARQQHPLLARRRLPRDDPGPQPGRLHGRALSAAIAPASAAARRSSARAGRSTGS